MRIHYSSALLLLCLLFGFTAAAQLTNESMLIGSTNRTYKQYLPVGFDPQNEQVSLVVIMHGLGGSNTEMANAGFNLVADTARIIAIFPQGLNNAFGQPAWNNGTLLASTVDDIGFMNAIVDSMILNYNVNPSQVYFTGISMGSIMSYHLACAMNDRIAAIGCMSGTMSTSDINSCVPTYVTPVIHFHGTTDDVVPYDSNPLPSLSLVPETMAFWKNAHNCGMTADSLRLPDTAADGITVDRFRYDDCAPAASLELWRLNNGMHTYFYEPLNDITEMIEIWLFFRRWAHPSPATAGLEYHALKEPKIAPNPSNGLITVSSEQAFDYVIRDLNGTAIVSGRMEAGSETLDISTAANGMYLLQTAGKSYKVIKN